MVFRGAVDPRRRGAVQVALEETRRGFQGIEQVFRVVVFVALLRLARLLDMPDDIPVLAYGIRTDFRTRAFPGSARLMEVSHSLEELKTICRCGRKALFNARLVGGRFVFDGDQVAIDDLDHDQVTYESLCAQDYLLASGGRLS